MAAVWEDISSNYIYNQIEGLARDFVREQLASIKSERQIKKYIAEYLDKLMKIRTDRSGGTKIFYIIADEKVIAYEAAVIRYDKSGRCMYGEKPGLYIKPEYRGQKIDGQFIVRILDQTVERWFKQAEIKYQVINTLAVNERQIALYKREGYKEIRRKRGVVYLKKF